MDIEKALKLKKPNDILRACHEAETRNCEQKVVRRLYKNYYKACDKENR